MAKARSKKSFCFCDEGTFKERTDTVLKLCKKLRPLIVTSSIFGSAFLIFVYIMYSTGARTTEFRIHSFINLPSNNLEINVLKQNYKSENKNSSGATRLKLSAAFDVRGLGNLMFQYASLLGMAVHSNREAIIPRHFPLLKYFHLNATEENSNHLIKDWPEVLEYKANTFDRVIYDLPKTSNFSIRIVGYLQSWMYFQEALNEVKRDFTFGLNIKTEAAAWLKQTEMKFINTKLKNESTLRTLVGIHVRRGDMTKRDSLDYGYVVADLNYILKAMDYFATKYKNVLFIYSSDDITWGKSKMSNTGYNVEFSESHSDIVDLAILTNCHHVITTTGTFSWWAGFLSPGEVIYYKNFPKKGSSLEKGFSQNKTDYFFPGWIGF